VSCPFRFVVSAAGHSIVPLGQMSRHHAIVMIRDGCARGTTPGDGFVTSGQWPDARHGLCSAEG
jgi:hypothetical protein